MSTEFEYSGSRVAGYSGHRRRESLDYGTGRTANGNIPSSIRKVPHSVHFFLKGVYAKHLFHVGLRNSR
jgi:hypothetical protein